MSHRILPSRTLWCGALALAATVACTDRTSAPTAIMSADAASPRSPRSPSFYMSGATLDSLNVAIHGHAPVQSASTWTYTATVTNYTTSRRYYWWFRQDCGASTCDGYPYIAIDSGEALAQVAIPFAATTNDVHLLVQVAEIDGTRTGSSRDFEIIGPAGLSGGGTTIACGYNDVFYPHYGFFTDTSGTRVRPFRRTSCGNTVEWKPGT